MMSKRGSVEFAVLVAVIVVAMIGLYIALKSDSPQKEGVVAVSVQPVTGQFGAPGIKEYGGSISGIGSGISRGFDAGRALEMGRQSCFTCSCLTEGLTADEKDVAARVCRDNCGGEITLSTPGPCR